MRLANPYNPRSQKARVWEEGRLVGKGECIDGLREAAQNLQDWRLIGLLEEWGRDYLSLQEEIMRRMI